MCMSSSTIFVSTVQYSCYPVFKESICCIRVNLGGMHTCQNLPVDTLCSYGHNVYVPLNECVKTPLKTTTSPQTGSALDGNLHMS